MSTTVLDELKVVNGWLGLNDSQKKALYEQFCKVKGATVNPEEFLAALNVENKNVNAESVMKASQVGVPTPFATIPTNTHKATSNVSEDKVDYKQKYDKIKTPKIMYTPIVLVSVGRDRERKQTTVFHITHKIGPNIHSSKIKNLKVAGFREITPSMREQAAEKAVALAAAQERINSRANVLADLGDNVEQCVADTKQVHQDVTSSAEKPKKSMTSRIAGLFSGKT